MLERYGDVRGAPVVASGDAAVVPQLGEEARDHVALAGKPLLKQGRRRLLFCGMSCFWIRRRMRLASMNSPAGA
ncbi:hypothetical protein [Xanthobacter albus]|uniref:hypothetical protein n=1 Tax=Xanthobacter albus TaxID=3119929 RepID=UPI00372D8365